jgi:hypothetical protein
LGRQTDTAGYRARCETTRSRTLQSRRDDAQKVNEALAINDDRAGAGEDSTVPVPAPGSAVPQARLCTAPPRSAVVRAASSRRRARHRQASTPAKCRPDFRRPLPGIVKQVGDIADLRSRHTSRQVGRCRSSLDFGTSHSSSAPIRPRRLVRHLCHNRGCFHVEHLALGGGGAMPPGAAR